MLVFLNDDRSLTAQERAAAITEAADAIQAAGAPLAAAEIRSSFAETE
jgi:hypothetical protein